MFNEFLKCTQDKSEFEIVTIKCGECTLEVSLIDLRTYIKAIQVSLKFVEWHNKNIK